ncbi:hypothetical protein LOK49_LG07G02843 [Camellia lanceoleosa]|uniref:Uncharacterized protein n=1 Tax=Camellia lanceoleosa TaxID=1840588 RepID=A0ACC0H567_9ERIC|nr:hypothetical protein LOK49_LG07G02843 [Camellia lanceoleosa]
MRRKNGVGGRPSLSNLPPQPSPMAFSFLAQLSDSEAHPDCSRNGMWVNEVNSSDPCNIVRETSSDSDDDRLCHGLAPKTNGNPTEKSSGLGPQGIHEQEFCLEMDWTEKEVCIKCDKGGEVLGCSDSCCPLAVHEECMHCSARFDGAGNFYCPYCSYKRAMLERCKARKKAMLAKKALSIFLNVDPHKQKAERVGRKEPNPSTVVRDTEYNDTRNKLELNRNEVSVQIEAHHREERFNCECTTSIVPYKGAEASATNERNDVVLSRCGDNARPYDGRQHKIVIGKQMRAGPIIACGHVGGACCREEETGHQFKMVQVGKSVQVEHPRLVDHHQSERVVQDEQQAQPLSASPLEEETTLGGACWRHVKKKNKIVVRPPSFDHLRRPARKLTFELNTNVVHQEGKNAASKSRVRLMKPSFPNVRRKKQPWTAEEEEMLKEGVQKFSTLVNKNLPWRKILEFGCHVFDGTRTPVDLKDKWRNILVKECSTK